jgi:MSHA pilin protein MshD
MSIKRLRQAGLTMIELIVFIVIMGVALAGVLTVFAYTSNSSADPLQRKQAMLLAEALLEEVSLARFTYCHPNDAAADTATSAAGCATLPENVGPRAGEVRPFFNVNDYVTTFGTKTSFTPGDPLGGITDVTGAALPSRLAFYKAFVTINSVAKFGPPGMEIGAVAAPVNGADTDVLHISVRVEFGNNQSIVLDRYRTRYAPNSTP